MFDVGGPELIMILLAIVVLFGPKKLPELARSFGKGMAHVRRAQNEFRRNMNDIAHDIEQETGIKEFTSPQSFTSGSVARTPDKKTPEALPENKVDVPAPSKPQEHSKPTT